MNTSPRFRRGDTSPLRPGLVFFRYLKHREMWVTPETMCRKRANAKRVDKKWKASHKGRRYMRNYFKTYFTQRPDQRARQSAYYKQPEVRARYRAKYAANPDHFKALQQKPNARLSQKKSRLKRRPRINEWAREYRKRRMQTDPVFYLSDICRKRIACAIKNRGLRKNSRTAKMLGCSFQFFKGWIEKQFGEGMSWNNHGSKNGQWEIHHTIPIARFALEIEEERNKAFHYSNCEPKWAEENRALSDFIEHNGQTVRARELRTIIPFQQAA